MYTANMVAIELAYQDLLAIYKSQEETLVEYSAIIINRDNELIMLRAMLTEANEEISKQESSVNKLNELGLYISELQSHVQNNSRSIISQPAVEHHVCAEQQLKELRQHYSYLQIQLEDMEKELLELTSRNSILQLQTGRLAALESSLANTEARIGL